MNILEMNHPHIFRTLLKALIHPQMHVFERNQLLVPLLVALNVLLEQGEVTEKELTAGRTMGGVEAQLDLAAAGDTGQESPGQQTSVDIRQGTLLYLKW